MKPLDPRSPLLVGVGAVQQKEPNFEVAAEAIELMAQSLFLAAEDLCEKGGSGLLQHLDQVQVPKGIWSYPDPARMLAERVGAGTATTVLGEIGVLQQTLMSRACEQIAAGDVDMVAVVGGEAKYRALCAQKAGREAGETEQIATEPDLTLHPDSDLWSEVESAAGLGMPVGYYAIMDSALRYQQGLSPDAHRDEMARMYSRFSEVACSNPDAWADEIVDEAFVREHAPKNRMLAWPYTKLHNSQWNVDQASALIFCSVAKAQELGIPANRWIYPLATTESNFMSVVSARPELGACPGFRHAGQAAMALTGVDFSAIRLRELYSCFPLAVRSQLQEFGMTADDGDLTVTGAMTFGGGPLNNFVLQSTVRMAQLLREQPREVGLVTSVSGMLTKQACALWSAKPGEQAWQFADVTEQARADSPLRELVVSYTGSGNVAGYTVLFQGDVPWRGVVVADLPGGSRTVAYCEDTDVIQHMMHSEFCGQPVQLSAGQFSSANAGAAQ